MQNAMENCLRENRHRLELYIEKMKGLSPLDKLNQGYAYASDSAGVTLTSVEQVSVGDRIKVYVKDGSLSAQITEKESEERIMGMSVKHE